jgi:hypothetical protein
LARKDEIIKKIEKMVLESDRMKLGFLLQDLEKEAKKETEQEMLNKVIEILKK